MVNTFPQPALPQAGINDPVVTILYTIEGILNRASAHYVSQDASVYCGQEPIGHGIVQHKDELKAIPSRLERILGLTISDDDWLAMQRLLDIMKYATADKFDLGNQKLFDMLSEDFKKLYDHVLNITKLNRMVAPPPAYPRPRGRSGGDDLETSKA